MPKYLVLYCIWDSEDVIKFSEVIEAKNLREALEKTDCNLELNVVIPLNERNLKHLEKIVQFVDFNHL